MKRDRATQSCSLGHCGHSPGSVCLISFLDLTVCQKYGAEKKREVSVPTLLCTVNTGGNDLTCAELSLTSVVFTVDLQLVQ